MVAIDNLVHQSSSSTGTGDFTLAAVNGKQSFSDAFGTGGSEAFFYFISNRGAAEYEWGLGHMSDATTLVRDTVQGGTNGTSPVSFSAGTKDVTNALPVDEILRKADYYTKSEADAAFQPLDSDLTSLAGLGSAADKIAYTTGAHTWAETALTSTARSLLDDSSTSAMRTTLGLAIGTDVQAYDADLAAVAGLSSTGIAVRSGSDTWVQRTITGTSGKVTVTNGDGVSGNPTLNVGSSVALLDSAGQSLSGGARTVTYDNGTKSSGTLTPDPGNGPQQKATNNGAHTLAPGSNYGSYFLDYTNGASAGAITTSGFTKVSGDSFDTTNAHKFKCHITVSEIGSTLNVQAMQ